MDYLKVQLLSSEDKQSPGDLSLTFFKENI